MRTSTKVYGVVLIACVCIIFHTVSSWWRFSQEKPKMHHILSENNVQRVRDLIMVISNSDDMWKLRESVGALHRNGADNPIRIYASLERPEDYEEISTWNNVSVIDIGLNIFSRKEIYFKNISEKFIYDSVKNDGSIFLPLGLLIPGRVDLEHYPNEYITKDGWISRGLGHEPTIAAGTEFRRNRSACYIRHKPSVIELPEELRSRVSHFVNTNPNNTTIDWNGKRVALLVPTYNKRGGPTFLTTAFLPSLKKTISQQELEKFMITLYIGHDIDDPILSIPITDHIPAANNFQVKLHRLPSIRWATSMWNILYNDAMLDGNEYFLQVGDDVQFNESGWLTAMTRELDYLGGVGLVGPSDTKWKCKIMTQIMVTRRHHEIFGWLYPPEIKDWYSDNWIQTTYMNKKLARCLEQYTVTNKSNMKERYDACDNLEIANKALGKYLPKLTNYLAAQ